MKGFTEIIADSGKTEIAKKIGFGLETLFITDYNPYEQGWHYIKAIDMLEKEHLLEIVKKGMTDMETKDILFVFVITNDRDAGLQSKLRRKLRQVNSSTNYAHFFYIHPEPYGVVYRE